MNIRIELLKLQTNAPLLDAAEFAAKFMTIADEYSRLQLLKQTPCTTLCHIVNECGVEHTQVAKVFREQQAAIDYAVEMNGHAEKLKLNTEYRLLSLPLA